MMHLDLSDAEAKTILSIVAGKYARLSCRCCVTHDVKINNPYWMRAFGKGGWNNTRKIRSEENTLRQRYKKIIRKMIGVNVPEVDRHAFIVMNDRHNKLEYQAHIARDHARQIVDEIMRLWKSRNDGD